MKLNWNDIGVSSPPAPGPPALAEVVEESPVDVMGKADNILDQAIGMIRKVDEVVGFFLQITGKGEAVDVQGEVISPGPGPQSAPAPGPGPAPPGQILSILDKILQGEGDIPLSRFVDGVRNQEPWLIKYATGGAKDET